MRKNEIFWEKKRKNEISKKLKHIRARNDPKKEFNK
jgi:hypothetical protein